MNSGLGGAGAGFTGLTGDSFTGFRP